jgi:hypothetical protein
MTSAEKLETHRKALTVNLDATTFGSFAEIGAGQEVARRFYAYPMSAADLQQAIKVFSAIDLEWTETDGCVSAEQLRFTPPLAHLYAYLLASSFLVPIRVPAEFPDDANHSAPIRKDEPAVGEVCGA